MKNFKLFFLSSLAVCCLFLSHSTKVSAVSNAFKVNDAFHANPPEVGGVGRVVFYNNFSMGIQKGQVMISRNSDGTGDMNVGDAIQLWIAPPNGPYTYFPTYNEYSQDCRTTRTLSPTDLSQYFTTSGVYTILVRYLDWCGQAKDISSLYLINNSGPQPFLDLPWDYSSKNLTFTQAAMSITSFFDHEYPLLSSGLSEPLGTDQSLVRFYSPGRVSYNYSSHDGYDYARSAKVFIGDEVLAAAPGSARYIDNCEACGNMIVIDHGNGFQTRYMHLQKDGLVTTNPNESINVVARQPIGKVGATGNVAPSGDEGAHIHFMVVEDKNHDGNFDDNIPDGILDPFGWQSTDPDPWEHFTFSYAGQNRTGNKSQYLWKNKINEVKDDVTPNGKVLTAGDFSVSFPQNATDKNLHVNLQASPTVKDEEKHLVSVGPSFTANAKDFAENTITQFSRALLLTMGFAAYDIAPFKFDSLSIYSSQDGIHWNKEDSVIDAEHKIATAHVNHFTQFALMGEKKDTTAPTTILRFIGDKGADNWFRSDVQIQLTSTDDENGLGADYVLYKLDNGQWETYHDSLIITTEGHHVITYYGVDKGDNVEQKKVVEFDIDKTFPELTAQFDANKLDVLFASRDQTAQVTESSINPHTNSITAIDQAGNKTTLIIKDREKGKKAQFKFQTLQYGNADAVSLPRNTFKVDYNLDKQEDLKKLDQVYTDNNDIKIKLSYSAKKNKTQISTKQNEQITTQEVDGLKILQLATEKGNLIYKY